MDFFQSQGFILPSLSEEERYEGTDLDANVLRGKKYIASPVPLVPVADFSIPALPDGARVKWLSIFQTSFWAKSGKLDILLPNGEEQSYFLKVRYFLPSSPVVTS